MILPTCRASAKNGTEPQGGGQYTIVRPLPPTQSTSNAISPTSQDFVPPTAFANTQAHQVYSSPISTLSKLCCTPKRDPSAITAKSTSVCTKLNPIAATARLTQSQPAAPTGVRVLSILLPPCATGAQESLLKVHNTL